MRLPRINLFLAIPTAVMTLPLIGLLAIHSDSDNDSYEFILDGAAYTPQPLYMYGIFLTIFIATWITLSALRSSAPKHPPQQPVKRRRSTHVGFSLFLISAVTFFALSYNVNVLDVLRGSVTKSDVRQSGALIAIIAKYFLPVLFAYSCLVYRADRIRLLTLTFVGTVTFLGGLSLGGKASTILAVLPGIIALFLGGMRWRIAILFGIASSASIIVAGLYLDSFLRGGTIENAANYAAHRAFILTAEVPYRVTERQISGEKFDYASTLFAIATNTVVLQYVDPQELYRYNLARSVSVFLYPDHIDEVNSGRWNHTPTVFSEGVLAFGTNFFWIFAILAASLVWSIDRSIQKKVRMGALPSAAVLLGYFIFAALAWVNSGGLATLIHPLVILSYGISFILLNTLDRNPLVVSLRNNRAVFP